MAAPAGVPATGAAVGRAHAGGGSGRVVVAVGPDTAWTGVVAAGAREVSVPVCGPGPLVETATGPARFRAVLGNARLHSHPD